MLHELRIANILRQDEWPGDENTDTAFRALEVAGESGELAEALAAYAGGLMLQSKVGNLTEIVKKYLRAEKAIAGKIGKLEDIADEMGDVIISIDLLATHLGIDLEAAVRCKFNKTSAKYDFETVL